MDASSGALMFDLGGVIVAHDNPVMIERLASRCTKASSGARIDAVHARLSGDFDNIYGNGKLPIEHLHQSLVSELGYSGDWHQFCEDWCCHFTLDHDMLGFVEQLAKQNRVMLFSNTNKIHWLYCVGLSGGRLSKIESYLSHEIGDNKPALSAFRKVAALSQIDPEQSIFIDDRADNVEAAGRAGFLAHHFRNRAELERYLRDAGPNWSI